MGLIPEEIINQVLDRSDITEVISGYLSLKKAGRNFKACCPFHHEKTPSFVVNRDKQIFHCFGCGKGGNAISFIMQHDHLDFPSAVRHLAQKCGISIPETETAERSETKSLKELLFKTNDSAVGFFSNILLSGQKGAQQAQDYLKKRKVRFETAQKLRIGFAPNAWEDLMVSLRLKNVSLSLMEKAGLIISREKGQGFYDRFRDRIIFPIFDIRSRCVGFGARTMNKDVSAKYINSPETSVYTKRDHLYGFHLSKDVIAQKDFVVVVEGYMDFLTPFQEGFENIVASLGTALTIEQIRLIRRYTKNVVMIFDADQAGKLAMIRSLELLLEELQEEGSKHEEVNIRVVTLGEEGEDPDSFVRKFGIEQFEERVQSAKSLFDYKLEMVREKYNQLIPEERAKICSEMLIAVSKIRDVIVRSNYLRKLSSELLVSEDDLKIKLNKLLAPSRQNTFQERHSKIQKKEVIAAERSLLRLMLEQESMISSICEEVEADDFQDDLVRPIVEQIFDLSRNQKNISVSKLIHFFNDKETLEFISSLAASADDSGEIDKNILRKDYINRIKNDRMKLRRKDLCYEIQQAESKGDHERLEELKEKFNQLIKR